MHTLARVAIGWSAGHLWASVARGVEWGPRDPGSDCRESPHDASKAKLGGVLEDVGAKTIKCSRAVSEAGSDAELGNCIGSAMVAIVN